MKKKTMSQKMWFGLLGLLVLLTLAPSCPEKDDDDKKGGGSQASWLFLGGEASNGVGGNGGSIQLLVQPNGGDLRIESGGAPAAFSTPAVPKPPRPFLGYNPWIVTADYEVMVYLNQAAADADPNATDQYIFFLGDSVLRFKQAAGVYSTVTGVQINPGVTLTLGLNLNTGGNSGQDTTGLVLAADLVNRGTIITRSLDTGNLGGLIIETIAGAPATDLDRGGLSLQINTFINSGLLDQAGGDGAVLSPRGGFGGDFVAIANAGIFLGGHLNAFGGDHRQAGDDGGDAGTVTLMSNFGLVIVTGPIDASGGWGDNGGIGGDIILSTSFDDCFNLASHSTRGGDGENGNGGIAGYLQISTMSGFTKNAANQDLRGGDAYDNGGGPVIAGNGGLFLLVGAAAVNAGKIDADGGDAFENGAGGSGGHLLFQCAPFGLNLIANLANVTARGGDSEGANPGGQGGLIEALCPIGRIESKGSIDLSSGDGEMTPPAPIGLVFNGASISILGLGGGIHLDGGEGLAGGAGGFLMGICPSGDVNVTVPISSNGGDDFIGGGGPGGIIDLNATTGDISFHGRVALAGGEGLHGDGGGGGIFHLNANAGNLDFSGPADLAGGDGLDGDGGMGGHIDFDALLGSIDFNANANLAGGDGLNGQGGMAGGISLTAPTGDLNFKGTINLNGGDAGGAGAFNGGMGGIISLNGDLIATSGTTRAGGGLGVNAGSGGPGGMMIFIATDHATNHMNLFVPGGDGDDLIGIGGPGGIIEITSFVPPTIFGGLYDATPGVANTVGPDGSVVIDGVPIWP